MLLFKSRLKIKCSNLLHSVNENNINTPHQPLMWWFVVVVVTVIRYCCYFNCLFGRRTSFKNKPNMTYLHTQILLYSLTYTHSHSLQKQHDCCRREMERGLHYIAIQRINEVIKKQQQLTEVCCIVFVLSLFLQLLLQVFCVILLVFYSHSEHSVEKLYEFCIFVLNFLLRFLLLFFFFFGTLTHTYRHKH